MKTSNRSGNEHQAVLNLTQTAWNAIPSRIDVGADVQKPILSTLRSSGCKEYQVDRGLSLLSAKICKTCKNDGEHLRVAM